MSWKKNGRQAGMRDTGVYLGRRNKGVGTLKWTTSGNPHPLPGPQCPRLLGEGLNPPAVLRVRGRGSRLGLSWEQHRVGVPPWSWRGVGGAGRGALRPRAPERVSGSVRRAGGCGHLQAGPGRGAKG